PLPPRLGGLGGQELLEEGEGSDVGDLPGGVLGQDGPVQLVGRRLEEMAEGQGLGPLPVPEGQGEEVGIPVEEGRLLVGGRGRLGPPALPAGPQLRQLLRRRLLPFHGRPGLGGSQGQGSQGPSSGKAARTAARPWAAASYSPARRWRRARAYWAATAKSRPSWGRTKRSTSPASGEAPSSRRPVIRWRSSGRATASSR